jgi:hypothetical protein
VYQFCGGEMIDILEKNKKHADLVISNEIFNLLCDKAPKKETNTNWRFGSTKKNRRSVISKKNKKSKNAEQFKIICHLCSEKFYDDKMGRHLSISHNVAKENIGRNVEMCFDFTDSLKKKNIVSGFKESDEFIWLNLDSKNNFVGNIEEHKFDKIFVPQFEK